MQEELVEDYADLGQPPYPTLVGKFHHPCNTHNVMFVHEVLWLKVSKMTYIYELLDTEQARRLPASSYPDDLFTQFVWIILILCVEIAGSYELCVLTKMRCPAFTCGSIMICAFLHKSCM